MPEAKSPLKLKLFEALEAVFPDGEVTVKDYAPGHQKLAARRLVHAHVGCRVLFSMLVGDKEEKYAVAGMISAAAKDEEIPEFIARLQDDKRRTEIAMTPGRTF